MTSGKGPRSGPDWIQWILVALILLEVAAVGAGRGDPAGATSSATLAPTLAPTLAAPPQDHVASLGAPDGSLSRDLRGALDPVDGLLPDGTTVFDDELPGIRRLDPALLDALRRATTDAATDGIRVLIESGWRSAKYQEALLRQAVRTYGSEAAAARWVATPDTSPHVAGEAIDIANADATAWLSEHGGAYGLCQIYRNEPWHFELRRGAIDDGCPPMYADPTHDPRLRT